MLPNTKDRNCAIKFEMCELMWFNVMVALLKATKNQIYMKYIRRWIFKIGDHPNKQFE